MDYIDTGAPDFQSDLEKDSPGKELSEEESKRSISYHKVVYRQNCDQRDIEKEQNPVDEVVEDKHIELKFIQKNDENNELTSKKARDDENLMEEEKDFPVNCENHAFSNQNILNLADIYQRDEEEADTKGQLEVRIDHSVSSIEAQSRNASFSLDSEVDSSKVPPNFNDCIRNQKENKVISLYFQDIQAKSCAKLSSVFSIYPSKLAVLGIGFPLYFRFKILTCIIFTIIFIIASIAVIVLAHDEGKAQEFNPNKPIAFISSWTPGNYGRSHSGDWLWIYLLNFI